MKPITFNTPACRDFVSREKWHTMGWAGWSRTINIGRDAHFLRVYVESKYEIN